MSRLYDALLTTLEGENSVILTANRRLARELRAAYAESMRNAGRTAWVTPAVYEWRDWCRRRLLETAAGDTPGPLSATASEVLWERCLKQVAGAQDEDFLTTAGLAKQAATAWRRLVEWQVSAKTVIATARSQDERVYAAALERYLAELAALGAVDQASVPDLVIERVGSATDLPRQVTVAGFDRLFPLIERLLQALEASDVVVTRPPRSSARIPDRLKNHVHSYVDEDAELRAAGRWARELAQARPTARIAIVVAQLEEGTERVARLIRDGFEPARHCAEAPDLTVVEVSYGRRLSDYAPIAIALTCLEFATGSLSSARVSVLLRSDWLAVGKLGERAQLERALRRLPDRRWTPAALREASRALLPEERLAGWLALLRRFATSALRADERQLPSGWAPLIDSLLSESGWAAERRLDSEEFQLMNRWRELLNELAQLDDVLGQQTLRQVVQRLQRMAANTIFQPERAESRVQVMGPLEAAGLAFDALWVARSDADRWPAPAQPSPLISRRLQMQQGMPDATPGDTLSYARRVLARLADSAAEVRFSWSRTELDTVRLVSPLLGATAAESVPAASAPADPGWFAQGLMNTALPVAVESDPVPPVAGEETLTGGAKVVDLQRTEPFSAFALGRLGVRELDRFTPGLPASLRGTLIHDALRRLYAEQPDKLALAGWGNEERQRRSAAAARYAIAPHEAHADAVLRRLLAFERNRTQTLLLTMVEEDAGREPFSIEAVEQSLSFSHKGVRIKLRLDRTDRLADGTRLIVDYKTGRRRGLLRRDGELTDLQLAVYATAFDEAVGGLALCYVNGHGVKYSAVGASVDWKPTEADAWSEKLSLWKARVIDAVEQIARGDVRVNLRGDDQRAAQLNILCRSAELRRGD